MKRYLLILATLVLVAGASFAAMTQGCPDEPNAYTWTGNQYADFERMCLQEVETIIEAWGISAEASNTITFPMAAAGSITLTSDGAAEDFTVALAGATNSSLILSSTGTAADAIQIDASAGGIAIVADAGGTGNAGVLFTIDNDGNDQFKVNATGESLTNAIVLETTDGGILLDADGSVKGDIALEAASSIDLTAASASSGNITIDAGARVTATADSAAVDGMLLDATAGGITIRADHATTGYVTFDTNAVHVTGGPLLQAYDEETTGTNTATAFGTTALNSTGGRIDSILGSPALTTAAVGQTKVIIMSDAATTSYLSVTAHVASDPEVYTFNELSDIVMLIWSGAEWIELYATAEKE